MTSCNKYSVIRRCQNKDCHFQGCQECSVECHPLLGCEETKLITSKRGNEVCKCNICKSSSNQTDDVGVFTDGRPKSFFISYSWADGALLATNLQEVLESKGYSVWRDITGMDKHQSLVQVIPAEIIAADVFIAVVTPSYQEKVEEESWPQKEFFLACSRSKPIMLLKEESVMLSPTLEFGGASKVYTVWATGAGAAQVVEDMDL